MKTRRRDRGVKKGESQNQNKDQTATKEEQTGDSAGKKLLKAVGKGLMYVGIGTATVLGVGFVFGMFAGKKGGSTDSEDEDDGEEDSDESEEEENEEE